jgi:hypothetical protein
MKRWLASLLIPLLIVLLCACVNTAVSYRLSDDHSVHIDYRMEITQDEEDNIRSHRYSITSYWKDMGFTTETAEADGTTTLTGTKTTGYKNMKEAAQALSEIMTAEDSLFYDVEFTYTPSYFQDDFSLKAKVSLENLLRHNEDSGLPAAEAKSLLEKAADCEYTLSIALPGEVVFTNANAQDGQVCTWNLKYGEVTEIELAATNVFSEHVEYYNTLNQTMDRDNLLLIVLSAAAGLALIGAVLILLLRARKRRAPEIKPPTAASTDIVYPPPDHRF